VFMVVAATGRIPAFLLTASLPRAKPAVWRGWTCGRRVPGLRITSYDDHNAKMHWLGSAAPVVLHLTRQLS